MLHRPRARPDTTDASGNYSFTGLAAGNYQVNPDQTTIPPGWALTTANDPQAITLTAGETNLTADFGYRDPGASSIDIEKTPDNQNVVTGGTATFTITVTNTGPVDLTNVAVTDPQAPNCDNNIGALTSGATVTYSCTLTGVTADFTNSATVTGQDPIGNPVTDNDPADVTVLIPSIDIEKTPDSQDVVTGGTATFTITVTNTGPVDLTNVAVTDPQAPNCDNNIGALSQPAPPSPTPAP